MHNLFTYVMAGGEGKRLWPASKPELPKQFLSLNNRLSMLQLTITRHIDQPNPITVITTGQHNTVAMDQAYKVHDNLRFIVEYTGGGTLISAIIAAMDVLYQHPNPYVLLVPADHYIANIDAYDKALLLALNALQIYDLMMVGVPIESEYIGYGYIKLPDGYQVATIGYNKAISVVDFYEKPTMELVHELMLQQRALWNTGIFLFNAKHLLSLALKYEADFYKIAYHAFQPAFRFQNHVYLKEYEKLTSTPSIDSTLCAAIDRKGVVQLESAWYDLGSWFGIKQWLNAMPLDGVGGSPEAISYTNGLYLEAQRCFFVAGESVLTLGLSEIAIIEGDEILFLIDLTKKHQETLLGSSSKRPGEGVMMANNIEHKPWGQIKTLAIQPGGYVVKEMVIKPGAQTSLQFHRLREEHMFVISGQALFDIDNMLLSSDATKYACIPPLIHHRIRNIGDCDLLIIEVQVGPQISESDIVRLADDYGRIT